jgi:hypothetical protein
MFYFAVFTDDKDFNSFAPRPEQQRQRLSTVPWLPDVMIRPVPLAGIVALSFIFIVPDTDLPLSKCSAALAGISCTPQLLQT